MLDRNPAAASRPQPSPNQPHRWRFARAYQAIEHAHVPAAARGRLHCCPGRSARAARGSGPNRPRTQRGAALHVLRVRCAKVRSTCRSDHLPTGQAVRASLHSAHLLDTAALAEAFCRALQKNDGMTRMRNASRSRVVLLFKLHLRDSFTIEGGFEIVILQAAQGVRKAHLKSQGRAREERRGTGARRSTGAPYAI